jgi:hypothetical protein
MLLVTSLFTLQGVFSVNNRTTGDQYCAKLRDGKLIMMHEGVIMTGDVTLENGTQIKIDGSVIKPDGETIVLKDGECIDKKGITEEKKPKKRQRK